jgi:flagellar biosynthetic protein FliP
MDLSGNVLGLLLALLLFTSFVKVATVLSICRYGLGLVGIEFGVVCLVVALALSVLATPPELQALGFPEALLTRSETIEPKAIGDALVPFMERRVDPLVAEQVARVPAEVDVQGATAGKSGGLRTLVPAFVLSELKSAFLVGCMILVPFVVIDLLVAHVLALVGVQQLAVQTVALPLKLLLFVVSGGWELLGKKLLGME